MSKSQLWEVSRSAATAESTLTDRRVETRETDIPVRDCRLICFVCLCRPGAIGHPPQRLATLPSALRGTAVWHKDMLRYLHSHATPMPCHSSCLFERHLEDDTRFGRSKCSQIISNETFHKPSCACSIPVIEATALYFPLFYAVYVAVFHDASHEATR